MILLCPSSKFVYRIWDETQHKFIEDDKPIKRGEGEEEKVVLELICDNDIKLVEHDIKVSNDVYLLAVNQDGDSIADEGQFYINFKSTEVPSNFKTFELYLEDGNKRTATYRISSDEMGKPRRILLSSFVRDKGFNDAFVTYIGVHFKDCTSNVPSFRLIISKMAVISTVTPHYCTPQDVVNFLGMKDNHGRDIMVDETTEPRYSVLADAICQAEAYIEQATRDCWTERRVVGELRNFDGEMADTSIGYGMYMMMGARPMNSNVFKGIPVKLMHGKIHDIDAKKGDKVEIRWFGTNWIDVTSSVWADNQSGILYIKTLFAQRYESVKVTYRYGHNDNVPPDIKRAAILFTAKQIILNQSLFRYAFPEDNSMFDKWRNIAMDFEYQIANILKERANAFCVGGL